MSKKILPSILILILTITFVVYPVYAESTSELQDEKASINAQKKEAEAQQGEVQRQLSATMQEISKLDASISTLQEEINGLNAQIEELEESIEEKEEEIKQKEKEHKENTELMEERLVVMYESGETTFLDLLFNSESLIAFISNYYTLSQITQCDKELLESIEKAKAEIEETKAKLEEDKEALDSVKEEKEEKNNSLRSQKQERQSVASSLSAEEQKLQSEIDSYNARVSQIEEQIKEIMRSQSGGSGSAAGLNFDGSFIWPCDCMIITSGVKRRWGRWHKGLDIGARYEDVYASASGYCYPLENPGGYGHYILMVHGDGWCTLYGHLDSYNVGYGEYASQGEVIATSGNTGASTGAHLHFEIRQANGLSSYFSTSFLDPLDYLPGGWTAQSGAFTES
ncbi:MAG: peptidoglycan DD-metalloendopeptidase family protein [Clostridia bacterium]|nr:peptidoglycan DD-metalloendopeptidase family protein [Clostridia bacterium]